MSKQVPFKCKFNHVTIIVFDRYTKSEIVCEVCLEELRNGRSLVLNHGRNVSAEANSVRAYRF